MFDFEISKHPRFDSSCRAFALNNNLTAVAEQIGMRPQMLRNKLNPEQPHQLSCIELLALTDVTEDPTLLDGLLAQLQCLPAVPVNEANPGNLPLHTLSATAAIGVIAGETVTPGPMTQSRRNAILDRANQAIRDLSLIVVSVEARFQSTPALAAAVDMISACGLVPGLN
ncbi:phage regulatory CII family protein [Yersinia ruckeri]|uniref:phage regulatory CII family protein n=1 Tax=Yersinia ruckeri TaxID=29486 RepID=UPI0020C0644E|nr:phage regulatory CII family protein [Yersinia ruckeri]MCK8564437.1 phage regulatory CII family protein [Yersinia ruckeri]UZY19466.1 phage regulatory CII family protein [Yersinia ruckeri]